MISNSGVPRHQDHAEQECNASNPQSLDTQTQQQRQPRSHVVHRKPKRATSMDDSQQTHVSKPAVHTIRFPASLIRDTISERQHKVSRRQIVKETSSSSGNSSSAEESFHVLVYPKHAWGQRTRTRYSLPAESSRLISSRIKQTCVPVTVMDLTSDSDFAPKSKKSRKSKSRNRGASSDAKNRSAAAPKITAQLTKDKHGRDSGTPAELLHENPDKGERRNWEDTSIEQEHLDDRSSDSHYTPSRRVSPTKQNTSQIDQIRQKRKSSGWFDCVLIPVYSKQQRIPVEEDTKPGVMISRYEPDTPPTTLESTTAEPVETTTVPERPTIPQSRLLSLTPTRPIQNEVDQDSIKSVERGDKRNMKSPIHKVALSNPLKRGDPPKSFHGWWLQIKASAGMTGTRQWIGVQGHLVGPEPLVWHTSIIQEAPEPTLVKTFSGTYYRLEGSINKARMESNGFPPAIIEAFADGFPTDWVSILQRFFERKFANAAVGSSQEGSSIKQGHREHHSSTPYTLNSAKTRRLHESDAKLMGSTSQKKDSPPPSQDAPTCPPENLETSAHNPRLSIDRCFLPSNTTLDSTDTEIVSSVEPFAIGAWDSNMQTEDVGRESEAGSQQSAQPANVDSYHGEEGVESMFAESTNNMSTSSPSTRDLHRNEIESRLPNSLFKSLSSISASSRSTLAPDYVSQLEAEDSKGLAVKATTDMDRSE
ncbi:hypothetical protein BGZ51_009508 [Haplosporangium sp. Z 767]|nr:hypothetical protein BGZ51_009508 [Haplosporangium sp. Z 767]